MSSLNSQVPIEWYPDDGGVYYDINRNILSKPFCSTPENAIEFSEAKYNKWMMYNSEGRLIRSGRVPADELQFDLFIGMEFPGQYYLQFFGDKEKNAIVPFIKIQE